MKSLKDEDVLQSHGPAPAVSWTAALLLSALYIVSYLDRLIFSLLVDPIKADLGASDTQMAMLVGTSFAIFYVLFALPMARYADRGNRKRLIVLGALIWNGMTAASAFAPNFGVLVALRIGVALGEAALVPAAMSIIGDLFERERRTTPLAIFVGAGSVGAASAMILGAASIQLVSSPWVAALPFVAGLATWRLTLLFVGIPGLLVTSLFWLLVKEPPRQSLSANRSTDLSTVARHLKANLRSYLMLYGVAGLNGMIALAMLAWYPAMLGRKFAMARPEAGYLFGLICLVVIPISAFAGPAAMGWINRRNRHDGYVWVGLACLALLVPLLVASLNAPSAAISLALAAPAYALLLCLSNLSVVIMPLMPPAAMRGQISALYMFVVNLIALGAGPLVVALLSDHFFPGPDGLGRALITLTCIAAPLACAGLLLARARFAQTMNLAALADARSNKQDQSR